MPIDPLHSTSQGARGGLHWRTIRAVFCGKNECTVAAFATRLQGTRASVFLTVAVCWTTHSMLRDIILLATIEQEHFIVLASTILHKPLYSNMAANLQSFSCMCKGSIPCMVHAWKYLYTTHGTCMEIPVPCMVHAWNTPVLCMEIPVPCVVQAWNTPVLCMET